MKVFSLCLILLFVLSSSGAQNDDPGTETTTPTATILTTTGELELQPAATSIDHVTNNPLDNGMVIKDITDDNDVYNRNLIETTNMSALASDTGPVVFPINHRNYSSLQYAVEGVRSPTNHRNSYQDPYKIYHRHNLANMKPIKFEENSMKTLLIPSSYGKNKLTDNKGSHSHYIMKPFPYAFEYTQNWNENDPEDHLDNMDQNHHHHHHQIPGSYTFYPQQFHDNKEDLLQHDPQLNHEVAKDVGYKSSWKKIAQIVTALVPFGLLLATLTPSVFTIDANSNVPLKQRSEDVAKEKFTVEDVLRLLRENGVHFSNLSQCDDQALCLLARKGSQPTANPIERGFWFLAHRTPADVAQKTGMNQLFEAVRTDQCHLFKCESREKANGKEPIKRKIIRKRKLVSPIKQ